MVLQKCQAIDDVATIIFKVGHNLLEIFTCFTVSVDPAYIDVSFFGGLRCLTFFADKLDFITIIQSVCPGV